MDSQTFMDANFESGNAGAIRKMSDTHFCFEAKKDSSPSPLWFYFKIRNVVGKQIIIDLINAKECAGWDAPEAR